MRCRDLFILSWKYKDKQSQHKQRERRRGRCRCGQNTRPHKTEAENLSASLLQHLESRCAYLFATLVPHQLFSASMRLQEGGKRECERARPVVHVRHCFERSSYWNGKEWRRAGGEEQATRGGERKRARESRGATGERKILLLLETQKRGD